MKRALKIVSLTVACIVLVFWLRISVGGRRDSIELPSLTDFQGYVEGRPQARFHLVLCSDHRGVVFDVFVLQIPPVKSPVPPERSFLQQFTPGKSPDSAWSVETQRWMKTRAEDTATAYARYLGFEKGIIYRHTHDDKGWVYFFGTDYYVAVPHLLLIFLFALPLLWPLLRRESRVQNLRRQISMRAKRIKPWQK